MSPATAAVFVQALPVMFIVVFIGEQRITRVRPRRFVARLAILVVLVLAPLTVALLAAYVVTETPAPALFTWLTYLATMGLAIAMMDVAMAELGRYQRTPEDEG